MEIEHMKNDEFIIEDEYEDIIARFQEKLKEMLSQKRFDHSMNVMDTAVKLAKRYEQDEHKAAVAGLLHDCAREISDEHLIEHLKDERINITETEMQRPVLLHAKVGAILARKTFGIKDKDILSAIEAHTTGKLNMSKLDAIIYLADYIEPGRKFRGVEEIRDLAYNDLWDAVCTSMAKTISHISIKGLPIHRDTLDAYGWLNNEIRGRGIL